MTRRTRMTHIPLAAVALVSLMAAPVGTASPIAPHIIGFESDSGSGPTMTSKDNPAVHFSVIDGVFLVIHNSGGATNGPGLGVGGSGASKLRLIFDVPTRGLSIPLGNDILGIGAEAVLRVFREGQPVATERVAYNGNDLMDQVIEYEGAPITRAVMDITDARTIFVDDVRLAQVCSIEGGGSANVLRGGTGHDGIRGRGGDDRLRGAAGNDVLRGGRGADRLDGQGGDDLLIGGNGDDRLRTADGVSGNDTAYSGPADDACIADVVDTVYSCETVLTP